MEEDLQRLTKKQFSSLDPDLISRLIAESDVVQLDARQELLKHGQYVKVLPLVLNGLIKVYTRHDNKELLLYYIQPSESCVMSFSAALKNSPSEIFAITEEPSTILLVPTELVKSWVNAYPSFNDFFFQLFKERYSELIDTINHLLYQRLDERVYSFLSERSRVLSKNSIQMSHRQIATELGTVREVVSRVLKKLEAEGKVSQTEQGIEVHF